jgi:hypothetical protein
MRGNHGRSTCQRDLHVQTHDARRYRDAISLYQQAEALVIAHLLPSGSRNPWTSEILARSAELVDTLIDVSAETLNGQIAGVAVEMSWNAAENAKTALQQSYKDRIGSTRLDMIAKHTISDIAAELAHFPFR